MTARCEQILQLLTENKRMEVAKLSEQFNVSKVTIRKDLDILEQKGLIKREHGYALLGSSDDLNYRLAFHYDTKLQIAREAVTQIQHGETVMIESGSCCALLADEIVRSKKDITIITNSAFIASYIRSKPTAKIILLGGDYQLESQVLVGPIMRKCAEEFFVDKLFIGTDGFNENFGFTGDDMMRAEAARSMANQANKVIILTESIKFSQQGVVALLKTGDVSMVFTDSNLPAHSETILKERGVSIFKV